MLDKTTKRSINEETFASDYVHLFYSLKLLKVRSVESHTQKGHLKTVSKSRFQLLLPQNNHCHRVDMHVSRMIVRRSTFAGRHSYEIYHCARRGLSQIRLFPLESSKTLPSVSTAKHVMDYSMCRCASTRQQDIVMSVFDRKAKRLHRERASLGYYGENVSVYDYIKDEFGYRLSDRICDIKRKFEVAVDLGCGRGHVTKNLYSDMVDNVYQCELSPLVLRQAAPSPEVPTYRVVADEEFFPFRENCIDLVVSNLSLHWVNDLPGCLRQILHALKNDGVLIGSMFGQDTLHELRVSLQLAEIEREGGFAPHISPYTTVNDLGNLLTRAGFVMLTIDIDEVTVTYPSIYELMYDLKGMAENNCSWSRKPQLHRDSLMAAAAIYKEMYGSEKGVPATFQIINFIGWKPDPSQPKAAERGSGEFSLKDIDKIDYLTKKIKELREDKGDTTKTGMEQKSEKLEDKRKEKSEKDKDPKSS